MTFPTILVVDDEALMTDMLGMVLRLTLPVEVVTCNSSLRARAIMREGGVSLLLTDYLMPEINGINLVRELRAEGNSVPVILLTGYCDEPELAANAEALQPFQVIVKPWNNEFLIGQIRSLLADAI